MNDQKTTAFVTGKGSHKIQKKEEEEDKDANVFLGSQVWLMMMIIKMMIKIGQK